MRGMIVTWEEEVEAKGYRKGQAEGRRKGQVEGRRKGQVEGRRKGQVEGRWKGQAEGRLEALRAVALRLLKRRFGRLPSRVSQRLSGIDSEKELTRLAERVHEVDSLEELGLA